MCILSTRHVALSLFDGGETWPYALSRCSRP